MEKKSHVPTRLPIDPDEPNDFFRRLMTWSYYVPRPARADGGEIESALRFARDLSPHFAVPDEFDAAGYPADHSKFSTSWSKFPTSQHIVRDEGRYDRQGMNDLISSLATVGVPLKTAKSAAYYLQADPTGVGEKIVRSVEGASPEQRPGMTTPFSEGETTPGHVVVPRSIAEFLQEGDGGSTGREYGTKLDRGETDARLGYADGGDAEDVADAIRIARAMQMRDEMSHKEGFGAGEIEKSPLSYKEPLTGYELPLGTYPKATAEMLKPAVEATGSIGPYFTPLAPIAAARDVVAGFKHQDPVEAGMSALGLPGKAAKAAAAAGAALMPTEAQGGILRRLTAQGLYSAAAEAAAGLRQERGPFAQMLGALRNARGVKPEELRWSGIEKAFQPDARVTRDEISNYLTRNLPNIEETLYGRHSTKYADELNSLRYRIGQSEKRLGMLQKLGTPEEVAKEQGAIDRMTQEHNALAKLQAEQNSRFSGPAKYEAFDEGRKPLVLPGGEDYRELLLSLPDHPSSGFQSEHWDDTPNVLAHLRMSDREPLGGGRALHLEELQSDWGQAGREKGFRSEGRPIEEIMSDLDALKRMELPDAEFVARKEALQREISAQNSGVNAGPFVGNTNDWTQLALKRALTEAARGDYDSVVWTPGIEHAMRYNKANPAQSISYNPDTGSLSAALENGRAFDPGRAISSDELPGVIGREPAQRLLSTPRLNSGEHFISGDDLKIGGAGFRKYYDEILPSNASKLVRAMDPDARLGTTSVYGAEGGKNTLDLPSIPMTDVMKRKILEEGFPAYSQGGDVGNALKIAGELHD